MKRLYIDCSMGAAGDMLMGALLELIPDREAFLAQMNALGIPGVKLDAEEKRSCGITGTHLRVTVDGREEGEAQPCGHEHRHDGGSPHGHSHHCNHDHVQSCGGHGGEHEHTHSGEHNHEHGHHHSGLADICTLIQSLGVPDRVKADALAVYRIIAEAESQVHGEDMEHIHFHEVGTLDAVADVVGNCLLMDMIGADQISASPVHVGSGTVKCAHGILPVPAPATALILRGIPIYGGEIEGELCTPTGAALLKHFVREFSSTPAMTLDKIGYGMGTKSFDRANCVRVMLGEEAEKPEEVVELAANLDDMTAEEIGYAMEVLLDAGALDVYCEPIVMKKSRPATKLACICRTDDQEKLAEVMLKHTSTIGVRCCSCSRITMERRIEKRETPWGEVSVKVCQRGDVRKIKGEFDEMARIARENDLSLMEVEKELHE